LSCKLTTKASKEITEPHRPANGSRKATGEAKQAKQAEQPKAKTTKPQDSEQQQRSNYSASRLYLVNSTRQAEQLEDLFIMFFPKEGSRQGLFPVGPKPAS
jgi:hypothetical protein